MKKRSSLNMIYILFVTIILAINLIFKISLMGAYTNLFLILVGLYLLIEYIIRETQGNKVSGLIVFISMSFLIILFQLLIVSKKEVYFSSPNNTNVIIVIEKSPSLLRGYSVLYERKYWMFKKPINYSQIDGLNNFSSGYYTFEWLSEDIAIMKCDNEFYGQVNLDKH
ncbi:MAG: hypothetical protein RR636_13380 [Clostridium sp.]|uniref:hypothetical protein n=1 Tax=Clostridium sp. TaxID=1506 RepID=UPI0030695895